MNELIIRFTGMDASDGHIEIFSGLESAAGIGRALALIAHFAATGDIRQRFPFSEDVRFYLESTEEGSFKLKVTAIVGSLAIGISSSALYDLGKLVLSKAVGVEATNLNQEVLALDDRKSGDIEALVEAVEPALKKGHYAIGETVNKIEIYEEHSRKTIITFDNETKEYLNSNVDGGREVLDASISALNVNDRTGRAFLYDHQRTIPFTVSRDAKPGTMQALGSALNRYARKKPVPIRIVYQKVEASDGRLKRLIIYSAEDVSDAD